MGVELPFQELREPEGRCVGRLGVHPESCQRLGIGLELEM